MTGRDLILYILENGLEDEDIFKDGVLVAFMDEKEAAVKFKVGVSTIRVWYITGMLGGFNIGDKVYIPKRASDPRKRGRNHK